MSSFVLSVRVSDSGGTHRSTVQEVEPPMPGRRWLIFVHGHNVNAAYATEQWTTLRSLLGIEGTWPTQTGVFLWPSDRWRSRLTSKVAYPRMVDTARRVGRILGDYLISRHHESVVLVGHSLGAVVALSAAQTMRLEGRTAEAFALLGAAVKVREMVPPDGEFRTAGLARHEGIAYSPDDGVLKTVFRAGERLAGPFQPQDQAVGLTGEPASRGWIRHNSRIDHHSYWRAEASATLVHQLIPASGRPYRVDGWTVAERRTEPGLDEWS